MSKIYRGERIHGKCFVYVDGCVLPLALHVRFFAPSGFSWGKGGAGQAQLALAILCYEFGYQLAERIYERFNFRVVAKFPRDSWVLTSAEIKREIDVILAEKALEEPWME